MKIPKIVESTNYIDDNLISWATTYKPCKRKITWFRYAVIAACLCLIVLGTIKLFIAPQSKADLTEYCMSAEVMDILGNGQYKVKVTQEDENFAKGTIVILNPDFNYATGNSPKSHLKTGDSITITYSAFRKAENIYEITPRQIEVCPPDSR